MTAPSLIIDGQALTADDALQLLYGGVPSQRAEKHVKREEGEADGRERRKVLTRLRNDLRLEAYFAGEPIDPAEFEGPANRGEPTQAEIREACREIRKEWSTAERRKRQGCFKALPWEVPGCSGLPPGFNVRLTEVGTFYEL